MPGPDLAAAGKRLEEYARFWLPRAPFATEGRDQRRRDTIAELCRQAEITRNTWYSWTTGESAPTGGPMLRVAQALGRPESELWAAYNGQDVAPPTIEDAVRDLVESQHEQNERIDALIRKLDALANASIQAAVQTALQEVAQFDAERRSSGRGPRPRSLPRQTKEGQGSTGQ